jgi:hypothetical protein
MRKRSMNGHDFDPFSLVLGTVFALTGLAFLVVHIDPAELRLERVWPIPLIGLGLLIVLVSAISPRRGSGDETAEPVDAAESSPEPSDMDPSSDDAGSFFPSN